MTIREFAKSRDFEIVGKLTYKGVDSSGCKWYVDEAGNDFFKNKRGEICIADVDGVVY